MRIIINTKIIDCPKNNKEKSNKVVKYTNLG